MDFFLDIYISGGYFRYREMESKIRNRLVWLSTKIGFIDYYYMYVAVVDLVENNWFCGVQTF